MQTFISQAEINALSGGALQSLIRELENAIARERNPAIKSRLNAALRTARAEASRRQTRFVPRPPSF